MELRLPGMSIQRLLGILLRDTLGKGHDGSHVIFSNTVERAYSSPVFRTSHYLHLFQRPSDRQKFRKCATPRVCVGYYYQYSLRVPSSEPVTGRKIAMPRTLPCVALISPTCAARLVRTNITFASCNDNCLVERACP
jgi:hypothetical protein